MIDWPDQDTTVAIATVASAIAATASAALLAVRQTARTVRAADGASFALQILTDEQTGQISLVVTNVGKGTAKRTGYKIVSDGEYAAGRIADALFAPGDKVLIAPTDLDASEDAKAIVLYATPDESDYGMTSDGRKIRMRKGRRAKPMTMAQAWDRAYPDEPEAQHASGGTHLTWLIRHGVTIPSHLPNPLER